MEDAASLTASQQSQTVGSLGGGGGGGGGGRYFSRRSRNRSSRVTRLLQSRDFQLSTLVSRSFESYCQVYETPYVALGFMRT